MRKTIVHCTRMEFHYSIVDSIQASADNKKYKLMDTDLKYIIIDFNFDFCFDFHKNYLQKSLFRRKD